jgi:hypothetical protein
MCVVAIVFAPEQPRRVTGMLRDIYVTSTD